MQADREQEKAELAVAFLRVQEEADRYVRRSLALQGKPRKQKEAARCEALARSLQEEADQLLGAYRRLTQERSKEMPTP
jgi:hypothetical protein